MKRSAAAGLKIDVLIDSEHWKNTSGAQAVVRRAVRQAAAALLTGPAELAIVLTDDAAMRILNRNWRGIDAATNVLSFATKPAGDRHKSDRGGDRLHKRFGSYPGDHPGHHLGDHSSAHLNAHLGDIVLAYETVKREACRDGKPVDHHLAHLAVHGFLHLLGYDHASAAQARRMERTERAILRDLGVPDPYRVTRATARHSGRRTAKHLGRDRAQAARNA